MLNTGAMMPPIGFGTWKILLNRHTKKAVLEALAAGYRLIDTARIYGNEKGVGAAVRESGLARKDIFVTTKLWNDDQGYDRALKAFDASMQKLGLDYVDLYLIHWPVSGKRHDSWKALRHIHQGGRAHSIGVSNFTIKHLEELMATSDVVPAVNQIEFHPFLYEEQQSLLEFCNRHKIVVEAYSPLAHGKRLHNRVIGDIAKKLGKTNAQIMLRWCIQKGTVPLPKSTTPKHIRQNIDIFDFELSEADVQTIDGLSDGTRTCWDPTKIA